MPSVMWFRRDLRLHDHPALSAAAAAGPVTALFVLDDVLRRPSGGPRLAFLYRSLRALDADLRAAGGRLVVRQGRPEQVVPAVAAEAGATSVHVSADFNPYGAARDDRVEDALGPGTTLVRTGSPYAVAPGRVTKPDGTPYKVYSAFYRRWREHGWRDPADTNAPAIEWADTDPGIDIPADPELAEGITLPVAGEAAAAATWARFTPDRLAAYAEGRNRPDRDATSRMSVYLKYGAVHPRTLLAQLGPHDEIYRKELAWREFYAAILHFFPESARDYFVPEMKRIAYADGAQAAEHLQAWKDGRTGFPIVDAGMRQMRAEGWMHNRLRMIVASFLVKDLHIEWTIGAKYFMEHLVDGDLASNQHGWQWTAGTGTDAAPFYRVFNPTAQGQKFDPQGDYVRRWVPELRGLTGADVHEPWLHGGAPGYPAPIVDHKKERQVALDRYNEVRAS
ncbi:MAG: deoxyribodipyrimidine photo-lyase [bacterium]